MSAAPRPGGMARGGDANAEQVAARARELFEERQTAAFARTDRVFLGLMLAQWAFAIAIALVFSPYGWEGKIRNLHFHVHLAIVGGALLCSLPFYLARKHPGERVTRYAIAVAQMGWSALLIHLTGGRIETHFHVFGSLAFLAFYRDWTVLVPATLVVALDHLIRQIFWPESVFGVLEPEAWRFLEHAFWVVFEDAFLILSIRAATREMRAIAEQQARIELTEQLEHEMQIAARIQTALLPREPSVASLEVAAQMVPAAEVGGDYYDVIAVSDGCWIGIGDVAGHGLVAGLVMLQAQSAIKALVKHDPDRSPRDVLAEVNEVVFENVHGRLMQDEHMTLSLLRVRDDGRVQIAGAHQAVLVCRAATGRCERYDPAGTWIGLVEDIRPFTAELELVLEEGDLMVLFTDGVTEATNQDGEQLGLDRLCAAIEARHGDGVDAIRDRVLHMVDGWAGDRQDDDVTLLILRHRRALARAA